MKIWKKMEIWESYEISSDDDTFLNELVKNKGNIPSFLEDYDDDGEYELCHDSLERSSDMANGSGLTTLETGDGCEIWDSVRGWSNVSKDIISDAQRRSLENKMALLKSRLVV